MDAAANLSMTDDVVTASAMTSITWTKATAKNSATGKEVLGHSLSTLVVQGVLYGVLLVFGMLFNCCVMWVIHNKRSLHTITNMWVTSLCISQVLLCAISLPLMIMSVITDDWLLGKVFCMVFGFYTTTLRTVSILSVAGIALDRYHVITRPFSTRIRKSSARMLIVLTWWSGIISAAPPLIGIGLYRYSPNSHVCGISWQLGGSALTFSVFYITSVYILSLMTSCCAYWFIYRVTKNQADKRKKPSHAGGLAADVSNGNARRSDTSEPEYPNGAVSNEAFAITNDVIVTRRGGSPAKRRLHAVNPPKSKSQKLRNRLSSTISGAYPNSSTIDGRAALTIGLVMTVFLVTWVPYFAFALYTAAVGGAGPTYADPKKRSIAQMWVEFGTTWLSFASVVWDPLVYGFLNHNFRIHLRELYCCFRSRFDYRGRRKKYQPGNDEIYDENHRNRSSYVAANWRAAMQSDGDKEDSAVYFAGSEGMGQRDSCVEDSQEGNSDSAPTMTSLDGDAILSTPSSRRHSGAVDRNIPTTPKIFFTPASAGSRHSAREERKARDFLTMQAKRPIREVVTCSPARSLTSHRSRPASSELVLENTRLSTSHQIRTSTYASQNSILDDVTSANTLKLTSSPYRRGSTFSNKHEIKAYHSQRPLPMIMIEREPMPTVTSSNSFRLNERMSSSRRYKGKLSAKREEREKVRPSKDGDIFFKGSPSKGSKRLSASQLNPQSPHVRTYEINPARSNPVYHSSRSLDPRRRTPENSPARGKVVETRRQGVEFSRPKYRHAERQRRRHKSASAV